jgi:nitrate/nitrite-specific signal transduction histidine kinase
LARKKKASQAPVEEQEEKKDTLLNQVLSLVEHFVSYFELLFLYIQKTIQKKIQFGFIITIAILYMLFLKVVGSILIIIASYFALLKFFNGDHISTALSLGSGIMILSFILLAVLIKKIV